MAVVSGPANPDAIIKGGGQSSASWDVKAERARKLRKKKPSQIDSFRAIRQF
ncbi:hypothetical protein ACYULU_11665 [Breznakiellaceae bacterium SP9]